MRCEANACPICIPDCYFLIHLVYSCGNVGKLTRIADAVSGPAFSSTYPRKNPIAPFLVLGGFIDFLTPSAFANGHGAITGLGNVSPVRTFILYLLQF